MLIGMRRVRYFVACSLDGFLARTDGSVDWLFMDRDYGMKAFFAGVDVAVMGRRTYEKARELGQESFPGMEGFVFTHSLGASQKVRFVSGGVGEWLREMRGCSGKDIWLVGGGNLVRQFLEARVRSMRLCLRCILAGLPVFPGPFGEMELRMMKVTPYETGLIQPTYAVG